MINPRRDIFPYILLGTKKRTVHIRTVRFVQHVDENSKNNEEQLFRR